MSWIFLISNERISRVSYHEHPRQSPSDKGEAVAFLLFAKEGKRCISPLLLKGGTGDFSDGDGHRRVHDRWE